MRIVGVNGINTHGEGNIDLVLAEMSARGYDVVDVTLPKRHWVSARWGGKEDGELVAMASRPGDILVAHSFGGVRAHYAHKLNEYAAIVLIAPAHGSRAEWYAPENVYCYYSPSDWIVWVGAHIPFHPFGKAGVVGYSQEGVHNILCAGSDHNDYFKGAFLNEICDRLACLAARRVHDNVC